MTESDILDRLRAYVRENFLYMRPNFQLHDDDSLLTKRVIDSLGIMELVEFVEQRFDVNVDPADITEENFGSLASIGRYVEARRSARPA